MEQQIADLLRELAKELGTTTEYLWGVLIKQAQVTIFQNILIVIFCLGYIFLSPRLHRILEAKKKARDEQKSYLDENLWVFPIAVHWVVVGVLAIIILFICAELFTLFINPEYWALDKILSVIK